jgi:hypothetical protein
MFASSAAVVGLIIVVVMSMGFSVCVYDPRSSSSDEDDEGSDEPGFIVAELACETMPKNIDHFFGAS